MLLGSKGSGMSTILSKIFSLHPFFHFNPSFQIITMYWEWKGFINLYTYKLFDGMVTVDGDLLRSSVMLYINHDRITTKDCLSFLIIERITQVWVSIALEINLGSNSPSIRHITKIINRRHHFCFMERLTHIFIRNV